MRRRRATTLVEILVFTGIGLGVATAAWMVFSQSMKKGTAADRKFQAVQHALLLSMRLEKDLESLYEGPLQLMDYEVGTVTSRLTFHRFGPVSAESTWEPLPIQQVTYLFDAPSGKVTRTVDGKSEVLYGDFERVNFRIADPVPDLGGGLVPEAPALLFSVVGTTWETLERPEAERERWERTVLVGGQPRAGVSARAAYPFWNPVPYGP